MGRKSGGINYKYSHQIFSIWPYTVMFGVFFCPVNVGQATFEALAQIVRRVHGLLEDKNDHNGRNSVLASYIQYCCTMPHQGLVHQGWLVFFISHNLHKFYVLHKWKIIR